MVQDVLVPVQNTRACLHSLVKMDEIHTAKLSARIVLYRQYEDVVVAIGSHLDLDWFLMMGLVTVILAFDDDPCF